jgi:serine/threonine protein phosphatase PrpC
MDVKGNPQGPARVWKTKGGVPGLAMSRSFGDLVAKSIGVSHQPEIYSLNLDEVKPKFIIIASDGIWEFLESEQVISIVEPYFKINDAEGAAEMLFNKATASWKQEDFIIDDITVIVVFLSINNEIPK